MPVVVPQLLASDGHRGLRAAIADQSPYAIEPIDPASVLDVRRFRRDPDGTFPGIEPG